VAHKRVALERASAAIRALPAVMASNAALASLARNRINPSMPANTSLGVSKAVCATSSNTVLSRARAQGQ
jgi:hypothetical protein